MKPFDFFPIKRPRVIDTQSLQMYGEWHARLYGPDGKLKQEEIVAANLITTTGKNMLAEYITSGDAGLPFARNIAIGTGSTQPAAGDTDLTNEEGTRVTAGSGLTANTAYYTGIFTADNPPAQQTIREYALFSKAVAGFIFSHATAGAIVKETADKLEVEYRISFP